MDNINIMSGKELVDKGNHKQNLTLPELGLKDIFRNGSWLEQKQIQAALEARKDLVEMERVEKCGTLSQAEWKEDIMLAEVTRLMGGFWQFLGHNQGKTLYLYPEEALFLIEMNCLQLKYHGLIVSLQQAYPLLLKSPIAILHYRVYASLSRVGYKVFRHVEKPKKVTEDKNDDCTKNSTNEVTESKNKNDEITRNTITESESMNDNECCKTVTKQNISIETISSEDNNENTIPGETQHVNHTDKKECEVENVLNNSLPVPVGDIMNISDSSDIEMLKANGTSPGATRINQQQIVHDYKVKKLRSRNYIPSSLTNKIYESIPDICQKSSFTIKAPSEHLIPKNIFLNLTDYIINIDYINGKQLKRPAALRSYCLSDEANGPHVKRLKNTSHSDAASTSTPSNPQPQVRFNPRPHFRPFQFWRPRPQFNFFQYQFLYQRPYAHRYQYTPNLPPLIYMRCPNLHHFNPNDRPNVTNHKKRTRDSSKIHHMDAIKRLVLRLKNLVSSGIRHEENIQALQSLVNTYNVRYKSRIRISSELDIVDDSVVDTIELDDDDASPSKKNQHEPNFEHFSENFNKLKQLALQVKEYETKSSLTNSRHRRTLINAIRTFNKSYNAEVILNTNFEVLDRRHIVLASSSDSDCVIEEEPKPKTGKKLRNPFNILKRLSEKRNSLMMNQIDTRITSINSNLAINMDTEEYTPEIQKIFKKWLPPSTDFGRAEIPHIDYRDDIIDNIQGEHLLEYISSQRDRYEKWSDLKMSFIESIKLNTTVIESQSSLRSSGMTPIIKPEDCTDMQRVLSKLSIIKNCKRIGEFCLKVQFDVYHRDVQDFRKSDRPTPHFMIVCLEESSSLPSAADVAALQARYPQDASITFAIVGLGAVQYLHLDAKELPDYRPTNEL